jgi:hypothetical protein
MLEVLPPKNRLNDDLAIIHAEKIKSRLPWIQLNRNLELLDGSSNGDSESIVFIDVDQGT